MKKILFALFLLTITTSAVQAQELTIDWGDSFDNKTEIQKILGFTGDKMVAFAVKGKKNFIQTYNRTGFGLISSEEFSFPSIDKKKSGMLNVVLTGDHVSMILHVYINKTKSFKLYNQKLGLDAQAIGEPTEIYASKEVDGKIKGMKVDMRTSPDGSKALVFFDRTNKERTTFYSDVMVLDVDEELTMISTSTYYYKMRDSKSDKAKFKMYHSIENDGSFNSIQERLEFTKKVISSFALTATRYSKDGDLIGEAELEEEGKVLLSPTILVTDDKVRIVGYYMTSPKKRAFITGYSGLFSADLELDMTINELKTSKFSDEFFLNLYSAKKIARMNGKEKEILVPAPYTMDEIYVHEDGTVTILSEYFTVVVSKSQQGTTTTTTYGSILVFKLNDEGDISASDVIKKNQVSSTFSPTLGMSSGGLSIFVTINTKDKKKKYWSYASSIADGKIFIVFNDHFKNTNDDEDDLSKAITNPIKSVPFLITINEDGSFTKEAMVSSGDSETYTVPQVTYHTDEAEFVIWGVWKKQNKFGIATIAH